LSFVNPSQPPITADEPRTDERARRAARPAKVRVQRRVLHGVLLLDKPLGLAKGEMVVPR